MAETRTQTATVRAEAARKIDLKPIGREIDKAVAALTFRRREAESLRERVQLAVKIKRLKRLRKQIKFFMCKRVWTI